MISAVIEYGFSVSSVTLSVVVVLEMDDMEEFLELGSSWLLRDLMSHDEEYVEGTV